MLLISANSGNLFKETLERLEKENDNPVGIDPPKIVKAEEGALERLKALSGQK